MPQSDGKNNLKRMEFEFKGRSYVFNLNPEEFTQSEVSRSTVTQTKGGAFIDSFGAGLPSIFIKGTTGFKGGSGVMKFKELRKLIRDYISSGVPGNTVTDELIFHNYTDEESWVVHTDPNAFKLLRSKSNPLLFMYEINLMCMRPAQYPGTVTNNPLGGVGVTLGSPLTSAQITSAVTAQEVAYSQIVKTMKFDPSLIPDKTFTSLVSSARVLSDGQVQDFTTPTVMTMAFTSDASSSVESTFVPTVSQLAVETFKNIQIGNVRTYNARTEEGDFKESVVALQDSFIPNNLQTALKTILLEYFAIASNSDSDEKISKGVSEEDLERLVTNTRWVSEELAKQSRPQYDIIAEMRNLERATRYILNSSIYKKDVNFALQEVKKITK